MISSISATHFKCLKSETILFKELTFLAGSNSVGKSSVIQSILLSRLAIDKLVQYNLISASPSNEEIKVPLNGKYLLSLGNTKEVLTRDSENNTIAFNLKDDVNSSNIILNFKAEDRLDNFYNLELLNWSQRGDFDALKNEFYYLAAERLGPRLNYDAEQLDYQHVGWQGEYSIQVLSDGEQIIEGDDTRKFPKVIDGKLINQVRSWMNFIIPGFYYDNAFLHGRLKMAEISFSKSTPTNVGFGISYVLPIVVNGLIAKPNRVFIVENPEAHLHPKGQSNIGYFLAILAASGLQVIVETHSEHVINGARIAAIENSFTSQVKINFFSTNSESKLEIKNIGISEKGDLTDFPIDFFDQVQQDLLKIYKLGNNSR